MPKFQTKFDQATEMVGEIAKSFPGVLILIVCDSWFGNNGLFDPARKFIGEQVHLLSRLRSNATLYDFPVERSEYQRGRSRKYGEKLGNAKSLASACKDQAQTYSVNLYGKVREVSAYNQVVVLKTLPVRGARGLDIPQVPVGCAVLDRPRSFRYTNH